MLYEKASRLSPSELEERLREVAPKHKFGVLNVLDLAGTLRAKGIDIGSEVKVLDICHPHSAADALKTSLATATVLPCRIAVYQTAEGSRVATVMPSDLFAATGLQGNQTLVMTWSRHSSRSLMNPVDAAYITQWCMHFDPTKPVEAATERSFR